MSGGARVGGSPRVHLGRVVHMLQVGGCTCLVGRGWGGARGCTWAVSRTCCRWVGVVSFVHTRSRCVCVGGGM